MRVLSGRLVELALAAGIAVLAVSAEARFVERGTGLIGDLTLETESGAVHERSPYVESGARLRLRLTMKRPAALLVFLEGPGSGLSEVSPRPGSVERLPAGAHRLPAGDEAWETTGLKNQGMHMLLVLASEDPAALEAARSARTREALQDALKNVGASAVDVEGRGFFLR